MVWSSFVLPLEQRLKAVSEEHCAVCSNHGAYHKQYTGTLAECLQTVGESYAWQECRKLGAGLAESLFSGVQYSVGIR